MFDLTQDKVKLNEIISAAAAGVSIGCCLVVLLLALWVYSVRSARRHLDRISFRLLLWSLVFEIAYDVTYITVCVAGIREKVNPKACSAGIYFMMATMGVVNYLISFIAVNLAITIVLGLNPIRMKYERWYIGTSLFVGLFVPIIPAALGHFGWDPIFHVCWIQADNDTARMRNFVLDLYLWQILSAVIALVAVIATLITLFRQRKTSRALFGGASMNFDLSTDDDLEDPESKARARVGVISRLVKRRRADPEHTLGHLEDRFIGISLRISTYPIALIVVNGIITIGDLYLSRKGGVTTTGDYGLYCLYYFLYGARGMVFVALSLFIDTSLQKGLRAAWEATYVERREERAREKAREKAQETDGDEPFRMLGSDAQPFGGGFRAPFPSVADPAMFASHPYPGREALNDSANSLDMMQALFALGEPPEDVAKDYASAIPPPAKQSLLKSLFARPPPRLVLAPEPVFSEAFAGVPATAIPFGLDDKAHDIVAPDVLAAVTAVAELEKAVVAGSANPFGTLQHVDKMSRRLARAGALGVPGSSGVGGTPLAGEESKRSSRAGSRRTSLAGGVSSPARAASVLSDPRMDSLRVSVSRRASAVDGFMSPRTPLDRRVRRDRAMELAERLYEEIEAQL